MQLGLRAEGEGGERRGGEGSGGEGRGSRGKGRVGREGEGIKGDQLFTSTSTLGPGSQEVNDLFPATRGRGMVDLEFESDGES